jgi:TonB-linked SusC/RagA family outer membrane protein
MSIVNFIKELEMNQTRFLSTLIVLLFAVTGLSAQETVVSGTVTGANTGDPLPGANVTITNSNYGGATDINGNYSFQVPASGATVELTVRFIGYYSQTINVTLTSGNVTQDFVLDEDVLEMDAIVITGLVDATPKVKSPLSTGQVSSEALERVPATSPASALYGKVAGVKVVQGGGQPGDSPSILLRGPTSINASGRSQDPLYIIDGVVIDPSVSGSPLSDIPGDDIESIEVVKGAAGASMYGARAANGVIQIRTKRGNALAQNQTKIRFRSEFGTNDLPKTLAVNKSHAYLQNSSGDFVDADGNIIDPRAIGRASDVFKKSDGTSVSGIEFYDNEYKYVSTGEVGDPKESLSPGGYNQMRRFFSENDQNSQTVTISRNMENTNFSVGIGNMNQSGVMSEISGLSRQNVRLNVDHKFRNTLDVSFTSLISQTERDMIASTFGGLYSITFMAPDADLTKIDPSTGNLYIRPDPNSVEENPLYFLRYNDRDDFRRRVMSSMSLKWSPVSWANITGSLSYDRSNQSYNSHYPIGFIDINGAGTNVDGRYIKTTAFDQGINGDLRFMATRTFGDLTAKLTASSLYEQAKYDGFDADGRDFAVGGVRNLSNTAADDRYLSSWQQEVTGISNMGGVMLDYDDKYIADFFFRKEGSSLFGPDDRWHNYSRFAVAYRISEEPFWFLPMFNEFKLRLTSGTAGSRPRFTARFETWDISGGVASKGNLGNKALIPEFQTETEMGFDATLLDRFSLSATYVAATTENQILYVPLAGYYGYGNQWQNAGTLDNESIEAEFNAALVNTRSFSWELGVTYYSQMKSEITKLDIPAYRRGPFYIKEGEPMGSMWGAKWVENVSDLPSEATASEFDTNDDGYVVWVGSGNGWKDGISKELWGTTSADGYKWGIPIKQLDDEGSNFMKLGETLPDFDLGVSNTLRFGGLEIYALIDGQVGGNIYANTNQWGLRELKLGIVDQAGKAEGEKKPGLYYATLYDVNATNSHFVEEGTFFKLRELSVTYSLNRNQLGNVLGGAISKVSVGVVGRNLITWTDYTGYDPEVGRAGDFDLGSAVIARYDGFGYPNFRTISGVFEIEF